MLKAKSVIKIKRRIRVWDLRMLLEGYVWARDVVVIFYQTAEVGPGGGERGFSFVHVGVIVMFHLTVRPPLPSSALADKI